jgi:nucleotide-binding universal stress UspA family protein
MAPYKVLIPLDGSALSRQIAPYVQRLFRPADCALMLLRVTERPSGRTANPPRPISLTWTEPFYAAGQDIALAQHPTYASQVWENVRSTAEQDLRHAARALIDAGYPVSLLVRCGDPAQLIVEVAASERVDLVAMATHGRTGLRRLVLGSVTEAVLRELSVPLLLVRPFERAMNDRAAAGASAAESRTG